MTRFNPAFGKLVDVTRKLLAANPAPHSTSSASQFPRGGLRLVMTGATDFINKAPPREENGDTEPDTLSSSMVPRSKPLIPVKVGMLINLGKTYRGPRDADLNPEGRAATRRRRQMEKRA